MRPGWEMMKYFAAAHSLVLLVMALLIVFAEASWRDSFSVSSLHCACQYDSSCGLALLLPLTVTYGCVERMKRGEVLLRPWAVPRVSRAAPIDLTSMAAMCYVVPICTVQLLEAILR